MIRRAILKKGAYFDSVTLMQVTVAVKKTPGVTNAVVGMGTDFNIDSLKRLDLHLPEVAEATPNDMIIAIEAETNAAVDAGVVCAEKSLIERRKATGTDYIPPTLTRAMEMSPDANMVLISVPGRYAAREARIALEAGRHVMMFSDNVTIDEELELKELAVSKGLLMMGPDCGTAIINGAALAFANVVRRGDIGVVSAAGTGLQEVTTLIHRFGCGITQGIGVGGRDLSEKIGGRMTTLAVRALAADPATRVILMVSKPPAPSTQKSLFAALKEIKKPIVVYFIGASPADISAAGFVPAENLEDAARKACGLSTKKTYPPIVTDADIQSSAARANMPGPCMRGLYSGGTLCDEAQRLLLPLLGVVSSNTPVPGAKKMADIHRSEGHCVVDLGDDDFTRGRAHPMIDPTARRERITSEFADPSCGLILIDVVLGYGSHPDMAGEIATAVGDARKNTGRSPVVAATICGTDEDPQNMAEQKKKLEAAGIAAFPSNHSLVRFAAACLQRQGGKS